MRLHPMASLIINRCHVSESNVAVIRKVLKKVNKKQFWNASRDIKREFYRAVIDQHQANFNLYVKVMSGKF